MSALFTQCPGDTLQTETGKVDPAWKFKCTTAAREPFEIILTLKSLRSSLKFYPFWLTLYVEHFRQSDIFAVLDFFNADRP